MSPSNPIRGRLGLLAAAAILVSCGSAPAVTAPAPDQVFETEAASFRVSEVVGGLEHPWSVAFLPDGGMLITERPGRLRLVDADGKLREAPVAGVPEVHAQGQGGLLDVILDPDFAENRRIYLSYAYGEGGRTTTRVMRARFAPEGLSEQQVIFSGEPMASGNAHFGSRLAFDREGLLWITMGERNQPGRAQDLNDHAGSVLRVRSDGSVPDDNPFVGRGDARPEIWSWGHRNPQGMAVHPETGEVWVQEHGPRGGDEINIVHAGRNYGWPIQTHGRAYSGLPMGRGGSVEGMEDPLFHWTPSIAPSGMAFYTGDAFPGWRGDLLNGALVTRLVARLDIENGRIVGEERFLEDELGRIRDLRVGPDGLVYLLTDEDPGALYRLEPAD
ncbi:MAG TPA: PQQ-dependent sugar dehydrogenase [Geminicoccaceae bacterium]|nr:PQQ-dependent sugar dehydrogenase [Geminicoccaceae bacterium]